MTVDTERARHDQPPEHGEIHLPSPSAWPCVCAGGITLVFFGILTSFVFSVVGVLLLALALAGWIGELRHE